MADNPYVNKVETADGNTLVDLTSDTATAADVIEGKTLHLASGAPATGTLGDATTETHGLMSAADKAKLDGIEANANNYSLPTMSPAVKGGAKLGSGLSMDGEALNLGPLTDSGSGASVETDGCGIFGVTGEGWSEQDTTTGKNLAIPNPSEMSYANDVFANTNIDSKDYLEFVINLLDSSYATIIYSSHDIHSPGQYNFTFQISEPTSYLKIKHNGSIRDLELTSIVPYVLPAGQYTVSFDAISVDTTTVGGLVVKNLQLEAGSTATSYEPYTGGKASPNPEYPQEIKVARGRNLIDVDTWLTSRSAAYTKSNGVYSVNTDSSHGIFSNPLVFADKPIDVTLSAALGDGTAYNVRLTLGTYANGTFTAVENFYASSSSVSAVANAIRIDWSTGGIFTLARPQLEKGSTPTPYVPYGHVGLEVVGGGTNLWGGEKMADDIVRLVPNASKNATAKTVYYVASDIDTKVLFDGPFKQNTAYTIILSLASGVSNLKFEYTDGTIASIGAPLSTSDASKTLNRISGQWQSNTTTVNYESSGLFEGVITVDEFEPYHYTITPVPLPSKGFAGAIGNYIDKLAIDSAGGYKWVIETNDLLFDGSEPIVAMASGNGLQEVWSSSISGAPNGPHETVFSDRFRHDVVAQLNTVYSVRLTWNSMSFTFPDNTFSSASEATAWFASNNTQIVYPSAAAIYEQGYINLPELPKGATVSIPELEEIGVEWWVEGTEAIAEQSSGKSIITRVKGDAETDYRTGDVNLTPANIGAAAASHTHNYAGSSTAGGAADSAKKLDGFASQSGSQDWGNQTGTFVFGMDDSTGGSLAFRRDNPSGGQLSMILDGTVYVDEGRYQVLHTNNYGSYCLPLSGGSLTGWVTHQSEVGVRYKIPRKKSGGGGWAYEPIQFIGNDNAFFSGIGVFGGDNSLSFMYIGPGDYNAGTNLRISPNGNVEVASRSLTFRAVLTTSESNGTTYLSDYAYNYNHMRIFYRTNDSTPKYASVDVDSPNGKNVALVSGHSNSSGSGNVKTKVVAISGSTITTVGAHEIYVNGGGSWGSGLIYITRVEAWNE